MTTCPNCQHTFTPAKKVKSTPVAIVDTSAMSQTALYAHYTRTAPMEDLRFWIRNARMSDGLRAKFVALEAEGVTGTRAEFYRTFNGLKDKWGIEWKARERAEQVAA